MIHILTPSNILLGLAGLLISYITGRNLIRCFKRRNENREIVFVNRGDININVNIDENHEEDNREIIEDIETDIQNCTQEGIYDSINEMECIVSVSYTHPTLPTKA